MIDITAAAVDLGASSGRVILGRVKDDEVELREVSRFVTPSRVVAAGGHDTLRWDGKRLREEVINGIRAAIRIEPNLSSVGIDSWGVDYGLVRDGELLDDPYHYRDGRTGPAMAKVAGVIPPIDLFRRTGTQPMAINTIVQLFDDVGTGRLAAADSFLLMPNLIEHWLTGEQRAELSIASTTGLLGDDGEWDLTLADLLGIPRTVFPPLARAAVAPTRLLPDVVGALGGSRELAVVPVASHDTASAVAAVPLESDAAYISCGTWGLAGVEVEKRVVSNQAFDEGFTNELGAHGTILFQRNLMGLWLVSECFRAWGIVEDSTNLSALLASAAHEAAIPTFDTNDARFAIPGDIPSRISQWYLDCGLTAPSSRAAVIRCIVDSLADSFASAVRDAARLSARSVNRIHIVGGGARNSLLCQGIADRAGLPVFVGPSEATAIGNILVQVTAHGSVTDPLKALRSLVARTFPARTYTPRSARTVGGGVR